MSREKHVRAQAAARTEEGEGEVAPNRFGQGLGTSSGGGMHGLSLPHLPWG